MFVANAFMVTYLVMAAITIVNMFVAVILENYTQATEDVQEVILNLTELPGKDSRNPAFIPGRHRRGL